MISDQILRAVLNSEKRTAEDHIKDFISDSDIKSEVGMKVVLKNELSYSLSDGAVGLDWIKNTDASNRLIDEGKILFPKGLQGTVLTTHKRMRHIKGVPRKRSLLQRFTGYYFKDTVRVEDRGDMRVVYASGVDENHPDVKAGEFLSDFPKTYLVCFELEDFVWIDTVNANKFLIAERAK